MALLSTANSQENIKPRPETIVLSSEALPSAQTVIDLANLDDLDMLGPLIKSLMKTGGESKYIDQVASYIAKQHSDIERLCNFHYQEFIQSVDQLLKVRSETVQLKTHLTTLTSEFNSAVKSTVNKKKELIQRRQIYANLENTIESISQCQSVLDLALRAKSLYEARKYYSALHCLDSIRSQLRPISQFRFAKFMSDSLPKLQAAIRTAVHADLRDWFVAVREQARRIGTMALDRAYHCVELRRSANRLGAHSDHGLSSRQLNSNSDIAAADLIGDNSDFDGHFMLLDSDQIDFRPLYQVVHIDSVLGTLSELISDFEEQRLLQCRLFLTSRKTLSTVDDLPALQTLLQDITGFFIIETTILSSTSNFRSRAAVDMLWDKNVRMLVDLIQEGLTNLTDPKAYLGVEEMLVPFVETMSSAGYTMDKVIDGLVSLFERYCDILKQSCSETCHDMIEQDDYKPISVPDSRAYNRMKETLRLSDIGGSSLDSRGKWPITLPFSKVVPGITQEIYAYIKQYSEFSSGIASHHPVGRSDLDDVMRRAVDNLLIRYVHQPMSVIVEGPAASDQLGQVLQVFLNLDSLIKVMHQMEHELADFRLASGSRNRVTLQATESFTVAKKVAEKRIYDLFNRKITEFLDLAEYDFMPSNVVTPPRNPSPFLRDLVNFLTGVLYSTLDNLSTELKTFIYFEAFDHLTNGMLNLILSPNVRRINMAFVDQFACDVDFLERFVNGLGDANAQDAFVLLKQVIQLIRAERPSEYLDPAIANKRYNRVRKPVVLLLMEKLNNAAGLFAHKTDKTRRKEYETVIAALKKEEGAVVVETAVSSSSQGSSSSSPTKSI